MIKLQIGQKVECVEYKEGERCSLCMFDHWSFDCYPIDCSADQRADKKEVIYKIVEEI